MDTYQTTGWFPSQTDIERRAYNFAVGDFATNLRLRQITEADADLFHELCEHPVEVAYRIEQSSEAEAIAQEVDNDRNWLGEPQIVATLRKSKFTVTRHWFELHCNTEADLDRAWGTGNWEIV